MVQCEFATCYQINESYYRNAHLASHSFAGSDSTASTMQSFGHHVLRDPTVHARLRAELDAASAAGTLSACPQWSETQNLPYFQACLKEAMRMRPAVGLNITRLVPAEGAEIAGKRYPGGTRVAVNGWVLHRDREVFGADADVYRPERWIEGDARNMERYMFQFGGGSHLCEFRCAAFGVSVCYGMLMADFFLPL